MFSRSFLQFTCLLLGLIIGPMALCQSSPPSTATASDFEPDEIDAKALYTLFGRSRTILIDVRLAEEFAVSRIKGAIHAEHTTEPETLVRHLGARLKGAEVFLYCTLGPRSVSLGINVKDALLGAGARNVRTLKVGLIGWANANLPMVDAKGPTRFVHPADQNTIQWLTDPTRARFEPRR